MIVYQRLGNAEERGDGERLFFNEYLATVTQ